MLTLNKKSAPHASSINQYTDELVNNIDVASVFVGFDALSADKNAPKNNTETNVSKWFVGECKSHSYPTYQRADNPHWQRFQQYISKYNKNEVLKNTMKELISRKLMQDIFSRILKNTKGMNISDITVTKTNFYDDVMGGTDFIVTFDFDDGSQVHYGLDLTLAWNHNVLEKKHQKTEKMCFDFNKHTNNKRNNGKINLQVFQLFNKSFFDKYVEKFLGYVAENGVSPDSDILLDEMAKENDSFKGTIKMIQQDLMNVFATAA